MRTLCDRELRRFADGAVLQADSVFDVIPGDVCSSIVLAAAAAAAQKQRLGNMPLVAHACSSTTNPETLYGWWDMGYRCNPLSLVPLIFRR